MKRAITLMALVFFLTSAMAQVPQAIQYQAVIRDIAGNPIKSKSIGLRVSILADSMNGQPQYTETHAVVTNNLGLVNLAIGTGSIVQGNFAGIIWSSGPHFAKVEIDTAFNGSYTLLTTTQLLSVPYALYAGTSGMLIVTTSQRDAIAIPNAGMQVFNVDEGCVNVFNGNYWMKLCGPCSPDPTVAIAGPDQFVNGDSAVLQGNNPVFGIGVWKIINGSGGFFSDSTSSISVFHGIAGTTYTIQWGITNPCGSSKDTVNIGFIDASGFSCGDTLKDVRDGQQYPTVQIGTQCWMAKNLNFGIYKPSNYSGLVHSDVMDNDIVEKYCYENDTNNCNIYGGLYDWNEAMDYDSLEGGRGICPVGWHIPSDNEWCIVTKYHDSTVSCISFTLSGTDVGGKMKEIGANYWLTPNVGASNYFGFSARGGGMRGSAGGFSHLKYYGMYWSSTKYEPGRAISRTVGHLLISIYRDRHTRDYGLSIRCLKN